VRKYWLLKTDSLHTQAAGNSKMIIRTDINGRVCATFRLTRTTETDSGSAEEVRAL
jgi:hypothetical protein